MGQVARFSAAVGDRTRVLLVPSTRDVLSAPVLPQAPLHAPAGQLASGLLLANPSTLRLNEVVLGCTSADWLAACSREEAAQAAPGEERLPALAAHLLAQRCYFPLFPPPLDSPVDCTRGAAGLALPASPDLLVLPSDLAPFAKLCPVHTPAEAAAQAEAAAGEAGGTPPPAATAQQPAAAAVCVNPGRLTKGTSGEGTPVCPYFRLCPAGCGVLRRCRCRTQAAVAPLSALLCAWLPLALCLSHPNTAWSTLAPPPIPPTHAISAPSCPAPQAAPLHTSTCCRCPRRWPWLAVRPQPPTPPCLISWTSAAEWT